MNVGWSDDYDGGSLPTGSHKWLNSDRALQEGSADASLFVNDDGHHLGPIGRGDIPAFRRLDVVYTARDPKGQRRIVALYCNCTPQPLDDYPDFLMVKARHSDTLCIVPRDRPRLDFWPGKMGMRRWAVGGPRKNWSELQEAYERLIERSNPGTSPAVLRQKQASSSETELREADHDPLALEQVLRRLRKHQSEFRTNLLAMYSGQCAITGADVPEALEAAHIDPHSEYGDNRTENGLLLRADLHVLFDAGLLRVHPQTLTVDLARELRLSAYKDLHGVSLRSRVDGKRPNITALEHHWDARKG